MLLCSRALCLASANVREVLCPPLRLHAAPVVRAEHPWEAKGVYLQGSVLREDDGRLRMWYSAIGERRREQQYVACAESTDGLHWTKPLRPELAHGDWPATNIVFGQRFNCAAPFVGRYAQPHEGFRYYMAFDSRIEQHQFQAVPKLGGLTEDDRRRLQRHPAWTPDFPWEKYWPSQGMTYRATYFADSLDGLHWEPADGRFAIPGQADGDHPVVYDPVRQHYRIYFRSNRVDENGRRVRQVLTATSPDTVAWSTPELCLESDALDDPRVQQIHGMIVTLRHGLYVGLIQMMEILEELPSWNPLLPLERARFTAQLAVSADGVRFHRVGERGAYFAPGPEGAFDSGMIRPGSQWVEDGDRLLLYYDGRPYAHTPASGGDGLGTEVGIGVATTPCDRFAGLAPLDLAEPGTVLVAVPPGTRQITANAQVPPGASLSAALYYPDGSRLLSHSHDRCAPCTGDQLAHRLAWDGDTALPSGPLHLRLALRGPATVYALDWASRGVDDAAPAAIGASS